MTFAALRPVLFAAALALGCAPGAGAHELWIDPVQFAVPPDQPIAADIRVGEAFEGAAYPFLPRDFRRFDLVTEAGTQPVPGRPGDRPALTMRAPAEGLAIIVYVSSDSVVRYRSYEIFQRFVAHKDLRGVLERHDARGLPREGIRERYSRYAKSLVDVGNGAGADREIGLLTEIVAGANPYTDDLSAGMPVQVLYRGAPRADVQVELFARDAAGAVTVTRHRTDAQGRAVLPVAAGSRYLVDAVVMRPLDEGDGAPVWESLWASLTFAVPR